MEILWFIFEGIPAFFALLLLFGGTGQDAANPPLADHNESDVTTSAPPSGYFVNEESEETDRNTTGIGNFREDDDAIIALTLYNETHNIIGREDEGSPNDATTTGGFLNNPHHFVIKDSILVDNSTNTINHGVHDRAGKNKSTEWHKPFQESIAKKILSRHMILGAAHDSSARDPPPKCHPGTRIKINQGIVAWFYDETKGELILWIYGPAGVGKSAIVQTFAEKLASAGCLGASVFFSRPSGRNNSHAVLITIAYQLAVHIKPYCAFISEMLAFDPEIVNKSVEEQFKAFIVKPFVEYKIGAGGKTWGILLDGLDELNKRDRQQVIIRLVTTFVRDHPNVPLVWVISSRPEPHITNTFKQQRLKYNCNSKEEYVPIDSPQSCQDVEHYLRSSFKAIQQVKFPHIVAKGWPEETKIVELADAASGLFAFADVAIRFIGDPDFADPTSRLDDVLSAVDGYRAGSTDDQPFAHLDALYTLILTRIPSKMWPTTQKVLGVITSSMLESEINCVKGLSVVLGLPLSKVYAAINDLYSLLYIPPLAEIYSDPFRFHHTSFVDFLREPARSKKFHTSNENVVIDINEPFIKIWLDFKRNSAPGPSPGYRDRWYKYASQFHFGSHQPADVLVRFNHELFQQIHDCVFESLQDRWSIVQQEGPKHHWERLLEILCQFDAGTAYGGLGFHQHSFVNLLFDIWKVHREELTNRGVVREIQLQDLRFDSLEQTEEGQVVACIGLRHDDSPSHYELSRTHASNFKHFQECYPELQVLICGPPGSRYGMFKCKITEGDCANMPPGHFADCIHEFIKRRHTATTMYHCFPCSDDV